MSESKRHRALPKPSATPGALWHLKGLPQFQAENCNVFPSVASLRWFIRLHSKELKAGGAVLKVAGRNLINEPPFVKLLEKIAARGFEPD